MLYRVKNLKAQGNKELQKLPTSFSQRKKGMVGEITLSFDTVDKVGNLDGIGRYCFLSHLGLGSEEAVYDKSELEEITERQLELEEALWLLLSIFPNKNPFLALNPRIVDEVDVLTALAVPAMRKEFRRELDLTEQKL